MKMRALRADSRGQALLEFALILPILLMLVLGIIEFGRIWNINQMVSDTTREGARRAVLADQPPQLGGVRYQFAVHALADALQNLLRGPYPYIRGDERVFELVQQAGIDLRAAFEGVFQSRHQPRARFFDTAFELLKESWLLRNGAK